MIDFIALTPDNILLGVILLAGFYMAWNIGANDVANAIGTSVGSGALTLRHAVLLAAILEFCGAFFFGSHVAKTMQSGIIDSAIFQNDPKILVYGMLASLLAAGAWLQFASYFGLPVSTTHSIVGAVAGFGAVLGGIHAIYWGNIAFIVSSWIISPLMGGALSYFIFKTISHRLFNTYHPVDEAKKIAPVLVFLVITILSLSLSLDQLKQYKFTTSEAVVISLCVGITAAIMSIFFLRRISRHSYTSESRPNYGPEVATSLGKASKHLQRVLANSSGEMKYQTSLLLDEVNSLSSSFEQKIRQEVSHSEFKTVEKIFGYLQILTAALMAFGHGANDVANAIGPLAAAIHILSTGAIASQHGIPIWLLGMGGGAIVIGLATWGWRVVETIGKKITELTPTRGFSAELAASATILIASRLGLPISTTHTLVGAVIGVGLARGIEALNLGMTRDIFVSWIVTVPAGALLAVAFFHIIQFVFG